MTFKELQNWFGERGYVVKPGDFYNWTSDKDTIYWIPNNEKCTADYLKAEYRWEPYGITALCCPKNSLWAEIDKEDYYDQMGVVWPDRAGFKELVEKYKNLKRTKEIW